MDTTLLRTLTLKSKLKFGKYHDLTISDVINSTGCKGVEYLVWIYCSADKINYNDEVLELLGIDELMKIKKPGKIFDKQDSNNLMQKAGENRRSKLSQEEIMKVIMHGRKLEKADQKASRRRNAICNNTRFGNDYLRRKNQNRIKKTY